MRSGVSKVEPSMLCLIYKIPVSTYTWSSSYVVRRVSLFTYRVMIETVPMSGISHVKV